MIRTKNLRFTSPRIKIKAEDASKLLYMIKSTKNWTWKKLAGTLGVSEHTVRHEWKKAKTAIPAPLFRKLMRLSNNNPDLKIETLPPWWGQRKGIKSKFEKTAKIPKINTENFAEFYGAMLGDGCVYSTRESLCITCNSILDKAYVERRLLRLCQNLFNIRPKLYYAKNENAVRLVVNCKKIAEFFISLGFPVGKKKNSRIVIPSELLSNINLIRALLRGLIDTDGGIYAHPHTRVMFEFSSTSSELLKFVHEGLKKAGITSGTSIHRVQFYGIKKVQEYFNYVGSSNPRIVIKNIKFISAGYIPNTKETERLLKELDENFIVPFYGPVV